MNNKDRERIAIVETKIISLEKKVDSICRDVKDILENHLPHIKQELAIAKLKLALIVGAVTFLVTFIGNRLLEVILK